VWKYRKLSAVSHQPLGYGGTMQEQEAQDMDASTNIMLMADG
jgi:hypothetical protein